MQRVLITGAGTGFGHEVAMRLAEKGFDVIAAVEIDAQVQTMKRQAAERGVVLRVEKLDVTVDGDRAKALEWGVEIQSMIDETKSLIEAPWNKKTTDDLGTRPSQVQGSYDMQPEAPVSSS